MNAVLRKWHAPRGARVEIKLEVTADVRVSAEDAREIADEFLLMEVGDLLSPGDPSLRVGDRLSWEVPILLSNAARGPLGQVGRLAVDAETGDIEFTDHDRMEVKSNAKALSAAATPPAGK